MSQAGVAWASTQINLPSTPAVTYAGTDMEVENGIVAGVFAIIIAEIILHFLLPAIDEALSGNDDEDIGKACDFYEEHRTDYDVWNHEYMWGLGDNIWKSDQCDYLFDANGNDYDEEEQCYIWEPWAYPEHDYGVCGCLQK